MTKAQECRAIERANPGMFVCRRCMQLFPPEARSANKQTSYCRPCFNAFAYDWRRRNPTSVAESKERYLSSTKGQETRRRYRASADVPVERRRVYSARGLRRYHEHRKNDPCVYVIGEMHGTGPVKVGVTTDVDHRLKQLQTGSPVPLSVLVRYAADTKREAHRLECSIHKLLDPVHGEWFDRGSVRDAISGALGVAF